MNAEDIATALGGKREGRGWRLRCPAHDDHDPSLDIADGDGGKVLVKCRAGCTQEAVLDALRSKGLWAQPRPVPVPARPPQTSTLRHPTLGEPYTVFEYYDSQGKVTGAVCRWDYPPPKAKEIRPVLREAGGWRWTGFPEPRPLYRLPDLVAHSDKPVLVVEGEKTADSAREIVESHVVTTWPGGVEATQLADWSPLKGRDVVIWPDNDPPGAKAMRAIADKLTGIARSVRIVSVPPNLPPKWDLADTIPPSLDIDKLIAEAVDINAERLAKLGLINAADLTAKQFRPPRWAVPDIAPEGLAILAGRPKSGKSWMVLDWGIAVSSGGNALGNVKCVAGDVLALLMEDTERRLNERIKALLQDQLAPRHLEIAISWKRADEGGLDDIRAWIAAHPNARLIIIDTLQMIRGKPDRDQGVYAADYAAISGFKKIADETGVPIVLVHHLRKGGASDPLEEVSGTAGLTGSADTIIILRHEPNDPHGMLYVRGRDVIEAEIAIEFDRDTGRWIKLGAADDFRKTEERRAILRTLTESGPLTPNQIADALGKKATTVRSTLFRMKKAGDVTATLNGKYAAKG